MSLRPACKSVEHRRPMVFVFGSNLKGYHGGGAARYALLKHGAVMGEGIGHFGNSYALPTKSAPSHFDRETGKSSTLTLVEIKQYVDDFIAYARANPKLTFQVTRVGCGLAGLKDEWVAPMFQNVPDNCQFDTAWLGLLPPKAGGDYKFWGTF